MIALPGQVFTIAESRRQKTFLNLKNMLQKLYNLPAINVPGTLFEDNMVQYLKSQINLSVQRLQNKSLVHASVWRLVVQCLKSQIVMCLQNMSLVHLVHFLKTQIVPPCGLKICYWYIVWRQLIHFLKSQCPICLHNMSLVHILKPSVIIFRITNCPLCPQNMFLV